MGKPLKTACIIVLIALAEHTANSAVSQERSEPGQAAKPESDEIREAIIALRNTDVRNSKSWATAARRLTRIGKRPCRP